MNLHGAIQVDGNLIRSTCGTSAGYSAHKNHKEVPCDSCKIAHSEYRRLDYQKNKERQNELNKIWKNQNKDHIREKQSFYRQQNKEKIAIRINNWRAENKDHVNARKKINRAKNADHTNTMRRIYENRRRAQKNNNGFEPYTEQQVLDLYGTKCHICSKEIDFNAPRKTGKSGWELGFHLDHVIPISKGGADTLDNVKPAHAQCNFRKMTSWN